MRWVRRAALVLACLFVVSPAAADAGRRGFTYEIGGGLGVTWRNPTTARASSRELTAHPVLQAPFVSAGVWVTPCIAVSLALTGSIEGDGSMQMLAPQVTAWVTRFAFLTGRAGVFAAQYDSLFANDSGGRYFGLGWGLRAGFKLFRTQSGTASIALDLQSATVEGPYLESWTLGPVFLFQSD